MLNVFRYTTATPPPRPHDGTCSREAKVQPRSLRLRFVLPRLDDCKNIPNVLDNLFVYSECLIFDRSSVYQRYVRVAIVANNLAS